MKTGMLIGLAGRARCGKSTAGDYLADYFGFMQFSFAEPLKEAVANILGMSLTTLENQKDTPVDWLLDSPTPTPRQLLQTLGTEWGRGMVHNDIWVRSLFARIDQQIKQLDRLNGSPVRPPRIVVTDVRFENEAAAIRGAGGLIIHIKRDHCQSVPDHRSEHGITVREGDAVIHNNGSRADLHAALNDAFMTGIMKSTEVAA